MTAERRAEHNLLESTEQRLHKVETLNKRLQMLVSHLKMELDQTKTELDRLRPVEAERNYLNSQLQKMKSELSTAESRHLTDVRAAEAKWLKVLENRTLEDAAAKTQLGNDLAKLAQNVVELEQQLNQERADHRRTRRGLEHLQVHFSSLQTTGEELNLVHKDELAKWTY